MSHSNTTKHPTTVLMLESLRECEQPFLARATIEVTDLLNSFDSYSNALSPDLLLVCSGNQLVIQFGDSALNSLPWRTYDQLLGHGYTLTLENVQDNGNLCLTNLVVMRQRIDLTCCPLCTFFSQPGMSSRPTLLNQTLCARLQN